MVKSQNKRLLAVICISIGAKRQNCANWYSKSCFFQGQWRNIGTVWVEILQPAVASRVFFIFAPDNFLSIGHPGTGLPNVIFLLKTDKIVFF